MTGKQPTPTGHITPTHGEQLEEHKIYHTSSPVTLGCRMLWMTTCRDNIYNRLHICIRCISILYTAFHTFYIILYDIEQVVQY